MLTLFCIWFVGYIACYWFVRKQFFFDSKTPYLYGDRYSILFISLLSWITLVAVLFAYMLMGFGVDFERKVKW